MRGRLESDRNLPVHLRPKHLDLLLGVRFLGINLIEPLGDIAYFLGADLVAHSILMPFELVVQTDQCLSGDDGSRDGDHWVA